VQGVLIYTTAQEQSAMTFEPRMRGRRVRRTFTKKQSAREKREENQSAPFYVEQIPLVPSEVVTRILNALGHLGSQRFALPPFSEHFERWIKDVKATLAEFERDVPSAVDQNYRDTVAKVMSDVQESIQKLDHAEKSYSEAMTKLQQELTSCERERETFEREYRARTQDARRGHEESLKKLKSDIDSLDKQRLRLLRKKPSIFERILGRSGTRLEENTSARESRRAKIGGKEKMLKNELETLRQDYEIKSRQLSERQEALRAKLTEHGQGMPDDALDLRNGACGALGRAVSEAVTRQSPVVTTNVDSGQ
jgi:chromosome segregation ATPase